MSKPNAALVVLSALALCLPAAAATISADDPILILTGAVELVGPNRYYVLPGANAVLSMSSNPGDLVWLFAVADDQWGEADYGNILTLHLGRAPADGRFQAFVEIPKSIAGMTFHLQAVSVDAKGDFHGSPMLDVVIPDLQILNPPPGFLVLPAAPIRE